MTDEEKYQAWLVTAEELADSSSIYEAKRKVIKQIARLLREIENVERSSMSPGPVPTELPTEPRYEHECPRCVFLGEYRDEDDVYATYDLYFCTQSGYAHVPATERERGMPTVLARYGSEPSAYKSGLFAAMSDTVLGAAKTRAMAKGLLK